MIVIVTSDRGVEIVIDDRDRDRPPHVNRDSIGKGQSGKQSQSGTRANRGANQESEPIGEPKS